MTKELKQTDKHTHNQESKNIIIAKNSLIDSNEIFGLLVNAVTDYAIFSLDNEGIIQTWNNGAQRLKGYLPEEVIGSHFSRFYTKEDIDKNHPQYELDQALKNGSYKEEGWRIRKDGTLFWASVLITALKDNDNISRGFAKVTRDLSEKKKIEDELRESKERMRLMIESVRDYAIIMLDPNGIITAWNEGAKNIKGYESNEVIGKSFKIFYTQEDLKNKKPEAELLQLKETGRFEESSWRVRKDGTKFWAHVIITSIFDHNNILIGFSKVTRDLTEKKVAEDELHLTYETLEQRVLDRTQQLLDAQEDAVKAVKIRDEFLSIASHELNTPLTSLKLQIQMRKRQLKKGANFTIENFQKMVNSDEKQINRLGRLVDDMLDISKLNSGKFIFDLERTDLSRLVEDVVSRFTHQFEELNIQILHNYEEKVIGLWDRYRIEQVVTNLLTNTLKYGENKPISIKVKKVKDNAILSIKDNGIGISIDSQQRIFQQYERAVSSSSVSGLGLGLYIVKQIIENHNGIISVESELGKGSTFEIVLPLS